MRSPPSVSSGRAGRSGWRRQVWSSSARLRIGAQVVPRVCFVSLAQPAPGAIRESPQGVAGCCGRGGRCRV